MTSSGDHFCRTAFLPPAPVASRTRNGWAACATLCTRAIAAFAPKRQVFASAQNQAKAAILYLYKQERGTDWPWLDGVVQATRRLPGRLTASRGACLAVEHADTSWLIAQWLYGAGNKGGRGVFSPLDVL